MADERDYVDDRDYPQGHDHTGEYYAIEFVERHSTLKRECYLMYCSVPTMK